MIPRRWIVDWLEDSRLGPLFDLIQTLFEGFLFSGVVGTYEILATDISPSVTSTDLLISTFFALFLIGGTIGILYAGMWTLGGLYTSWTGEVVGKMWKLQVSFAFWFLSTIVGALMYGQIYFLNLIHKNAEYISIVRQSVQSDTEVGMEAVSLGIIGNPEVEILTMAVIIGWFASSKLNQFNFPVPQWMIFATPIGVVLFGFSSVASLFPFSVFPVSVGVVVLWHTLFVLTIVAFGFSWFASFIGRIFWDLVRGQSGDLEEPDRIRHARDGIVLIGFLVGAMGSPHTTALALMQWIGYKIAILSGLMDKVRGEPEEVEI